MATLYTPTPQAGPQLDWLAGLLREGQQLWQQERRLDMAKKAQEIQKQEFWQTQERLKRQEDFQNRKFMYEVGQDQRAATRQDLLDRYNVTRQTAQDERLARKDAYDVDPTSPENEYKSALADKYRADAQQTRAESGEGLPRVTTYWFDETGTPSDYENDHGGKVDKYSLATSPDQAEVLKAAGVKKDDFVKVHLSDGSIVERRWDDTTDGSLKGRWDFHGGDKPDPNDGKYVVGFEHANKYNAIAPEAHPPRVIERDGLKFVEFYRTKKQGGPYYQLAPTEKGVAPTDLTPELEAEMAKRDFKAAGINRGGIRWTRAEPTSKNVQMADIVDPDTGEKVRMERDPVTGEWGLPKLKGSTDDGIKEQLLKGLK